jgi:hypothetical protein
MGCAETVRYLRHATGVRRLALLATMTPGLRAIVGDEARAVAVAALRADRAHWFTSRRDAYFAMPASGVSTALADDALVTALRVPMEVLVACQVTGTGTDLTDDLVALDLPVLLIHSHAAAQRRPGRVPRGLTVRPRRGGR